MALLQRSRSHHSRFSSRSNRSGLIAMVKILPDFDRCQEYLPGDLFKREHIFEDYKDLSINPSYTDFKIPYNIMCQVRYSTKKAQMEEQFQREFKQLLDSMESAYEAARFMRHMCITTFWPPLHNRSEIQLTQEKCINLNKKQRKRLNYLMATNII